MLKRISKLELVTKLLTISDTGSDTRFIIDGGFYVGSFSKSALALIPNSRVLAFEPDPESYHAACPQFANENRIELVNAALGRSRGQAEFFRGPMPATNSLLPRPVTAHQPYYPENATLEGGCFVKIRTIEEECEKRKIKWVDLLKLDLQGGELNALKGARSLLEKNLVNIILTEAVFIEKYERQPLLHEIWGFLDGYGYSLYSLQDIEIGLYDSHTSGLRQEQWNQCDAIFVSNNLRSILDSLN